MIYDANVVVPVSYAIAGNSQHWTEPDVWVPFKDDEKIKSIVRSASGETTPGRYYTFENEEEKLAALFAGHTRFNGDLRIDGTNLLLKQRIKEQGVFSYSQPSYDEMFSLKKLPRRLDVAGDFSITSCNIETLPAYIKATRSFTVRYCNELTEINGQYYAGDVMVIGGHNKLQSMSGIFHVGGRLQINSTNLETFTGEVMAESVSISSNELRLLPEKFAIEGDVSLQLPKLEKLPDNLKYVGGNLDMAFAKNCPIPEGMIIKGNLIPSRNAKIIENIRNITVYGNVNILPMLNVRSLHPSVIVKGKVFGLIPTSQ